MNIRVAISGKMGSGKTTLAKALQTEFSQMPDLYDTNGFYPEIRGFGAPIRELLAAGGITKDHSDYRKAAQNLGMTMREIDPCFWIRAFHNHAKASVIIDDLRFKNEYEFCKQRGFYLIRVAAGGTTRWLRREGSVGFHHPSEEDLDEGCVWDHFIRTDTGVTTDDVVRYLGPHIRDFFCDSEVQRRRIVETLSPGTATE